MKKLLSMLLVAAISAGIAIGGTVAYLQSQDSDVNVMTLGNVKIEQHEYERVQKADGTYEMVTSAKYGEGYKLQEFTQAKPLYPAVGTVTDYGKAVYFDQLGAGASGGQQVLDGIKNEQDKFVLVENTGKSDAYVRTVIAFELGDVAEEDFENVIMISDSATGEPWKDNKIGKVEIDGNNYFVIEYIYTGFAGGRHAGGILPAGDYTYSSLAQVYMTSASTNEDCEAIDGNKNGTYDILVLSQAVQTAGFENAKAALDTAFGSFNETNVKAWFNGDEFTLPTVVSDYYGLTADLYNDGTYVLNDDFTAYDRIWFYPGSNQEINLNGKTIEAGNKGDYLFRATGGTNLILNGSGTAIADKVGFAADAGTRVVINDITYNMGNTTDKGNIFCQNSATIVINDGTFITSDPDTPIAYCINGFIEINGGFFQNTANPKQALLGMGNNLSYVNNQKITLSGGTFVNWNPMSSAFAQAWPESGVPALIVLADGYEMISETQANGDIWYSVVPE